LGCGTGAFTAALRSEGWDAEGIDGAHAMVAHAGKLGLRCSVSDVLKGLGIPDDSYDLVTAAYVVHGLRRPDRRILFQEAKKISRDRVLFHDYSENRRILTSIIE
jgi:predicted TPR repeat methyltransferase